MQPLLKKHADKFRFALVGGANTLLDFAILFLLTSLGLGVFFSNFVSTSVAFVFSFFVNKSFTFKSTSGNAKKQFVYFLVITMFGLWILQPIVIGFVAWVIAGLTLDPSIVLFIGKFLATCVTLVWNYVLYKRFVFKTEEK